MIRGIGKEGSVFVGITHSDIPHLLGGEPLLSESLGVGGPPVIIFCAASDEALFELLRTKGVAVSMVPAAEGPAS